MTWAKLESWPARSPLPASLSPEQVTALQDALLANADRLLKAALVLLDQDNAPLARSLAILGMEESGKAIALHERRVRMATPPEGEAFVDEQLQGLWALHGHKLEVVHSFLVREEYWFGTEPTDPEENARVLGTIEQWKSEHNLLKQRGFYVDVTAQGDPITPQEPAKARAVREVIAHVHQIGWQLRLGEHIEAKRRLEYEQDVSPATEEEIGSMRSLLRRTNAETVDKVLESMRRGREGETLHNAAYAFRLPDQPFENIGRPGYEAQGRELWSLMNASDSMPDYDTAESAGCQQV